MGVPRKMMVVSAATLAVCGVFAQAGVPTEPQAGLGDPLNGLSAAELDLFNLGKIQFERQILPSEGRGPVFNKNSCGNCHNNPIGGPGSQTVTRFGATTKGGFDPLANKGGSLLQVLADDPLCLESVPAEANVTALRVTPSVLGGGLIEAIVDADIIAGADPTDANADGISGRVHMVEPLEDPGNMRAGRFGWKAQVATLQTFSADAALNEIGFTNILLEFDNDPNGDDPPTLLFPDDCDTVFDPEDELDGDGLYYFERVEQFQRFLAPPPQTPKSGMSGETVFNTIGCNQCHTPAFTTSNDISLSPAIRDQQIRPYSNFLLHDMGQAADFIADGAAGEQEIRTPALWGLKTRDPIWHDGRFGGGTFAERVEDAILEHGALLSEGVTTATLYTALPQTDKDALIAFLESLGRREFDGDKDDDVDFDDMLDFLACYGGGPYTADDACAVHDVDQDGDVDLDDYASQQVAYDGMLIDCDGNGTNDQTDLEVGTLLDGNGNGIPDTCECPADCAPPGGNGVVNFDDLVATVNAFTSQDIGCDSAPDLGAGFSGNGVINFDDLIRTVNSFGPCP